MYNLTISTLINRGRCTAWRRVYRTDLLSVRSVPRTMIPTTTPQSSGGGGAGGGGGPNNDYRLDYYAIVFYYYNSTLFLLYTTLHTLYRSICYRCYRSIQRHTYVYYTLDTQIL